MRSFAGLLERLPHRSRHAAVPALRELAEAVQPGAAVVASLRHEQPALIALFTADLNREFILLGQLVGAAADASGGLILESIGQDARARVAAIIAGARLDVWTRRLVLVFEQHYKRVAEATSDVLRRSAVAPTMRDELEKAIIEAGGKRTGLLDIAGDVKESLFQVIEEARLKGMNPRETANLIREFVPRGRFIHAGSRYRAQLIARTEVLHAQRMATLETYRSSPNVNQVIMFDGESDEQCASRNGMIVSFDEAEAEMNDTHPNCVLAFGPVA
jgi:hypothetical protein